MCKGIVAAKFRANRHSIKLPTKELGEITVFYAVQYILMLSIIAGRMVMVRRYIALVWSWVKVGVRLSQAIRKVDKGKMFL